MRVLPFLSAARAGMPLFLVTMLITGKMNHFPGQNNVIIAGYNLEDEGNSMGYPALNPIFVVNFFRYASEPNFRSIAERVALNSAGFSSMRKCPTPSIKM